VYSPSLTKEQGDEEEQLRAVVGEEGRKKQNEL
jgi:hypothetical protein